MTWHKAAAGGGARGVHARKLSCGIQLVHLLS
jgi:hypothetical protein